MTARRILPDPPPGAECAACPRPFTPAEWEDRHYGHGPDVLHPDCCPCEPDLNGVAPRQPQTLPEPNQGVLL